MFSKTYRFIAGEIAHICIVSCALLASLVLVRAAVLPSVYSLGRTHTQLSLYRDLVADKEKYTAIKTLLTSRKASLVEKKRDLAFSNMAAPDLSSLLQLLITRAKDADIRFVKMQPEVASKSEQATYPVVLEMTTSYHSLGRFIASLESVPQAVRIDRLAITAQNSNLDVRILVTCFLSGPKELP
jgi:Tfp pilus assembly protein PilO